MTVLERVKASFPMKVIASSKVLIPSLLHPKVPYYSLIIEDSFGNHYAYKSHKAVQPGEMIGFEGELDNDAVAVWRVNYEALDVIENITSIAAMSISKDSKVLVLPTLNTPEHPYFRENTSPESLAGMIQYLKGVGVSNIVVAGQSFTDTPIEVLAKRSGLLDVCLKEKIVPTDLYGKGFRKIGNLEVSEEFLDADIVLNMGMMKAGKASSTDNLFKVIKKDNYSAMKYLYSEGFIAKEITMIREVFNFGESHFAQRSDKFTSYLGIALASRNSVNLDRVFNEIVSAKDMPGYIKEIDVSCITLLGRQMPEVKRDISLVM
jgi:hypothetical protein